jgi:hypothetical protein
VQNKANLPPRARKWARGPDRQVPQRSYFAKQTQSGGALSGTGTECAKQTQFPGGARWHATWGRRGAGVVQTNPIPAPMPIRRSAFPGGQIVQNEANFGGPAGTGGRNVRNKAKLGKAWVSGGQDRGTSRGQMRQTNPIPGRAGWDRASRTRAYCAKQTQFAGSNVQNEANFDPSGGPRGSESAAVCRRHLAGPATGQSRCPGCRRGVDSWSVPADADGPMNTNE